MRKEPFFVGDIVHIYNRGNRKQEIVRNDKDRWNFLQILYYFNNEHSPANPMQSLQRVLKSDFNTKLVWPSVWGEHNPLVEILAFVLMDNHYHLVLKEIVEGGVTRFMRKFGTGMTNRFNTRYKETGRLFQGAYRARRVDKDNYLQYLMVYIHIKNVFELYPGGFENALRNFDDAFEFALQHQYSSLGAHFSDAHISHPIVSVDDEVVAQTLGNKEDFKEFAKNCINFVHFDEGMAGAEAPSSFAGA